MTIQEAKAALIAAEMKHDAASEEERRARDAWEAARKVYLDACVEACGKKVGDVIAYSTNPKKEGKIRGFRFPGWGVENKNHLIADCHTQLKGGGWSRRASQPVRINVPGLEEETT